MQTFNINGVELTADDEFKSTFTINSHPEPYKVHFKQFQNSFEETDVVLVDSNVQRLYSVNHDKMIVVEATEENKSMESVLSICQQLLQFNFNKGNRLIVIGGGIIQDLGAFTAKIFKRGVDWVFYPTTLLSQCDSCIGGKTALNFSSYKNQLALFSAPSEVIIDTNFLKTLTQEDMTSGYGEIVKLFLTGGQRYVDMIDSDNIDELIFHSLSIKKAVVEYDEFEKSERRSLNYGHSFGHVIEPMTNYTIPHGEAVMLGIEIINQLFDKNPTITNLVSKFTSLEKIRELDLKKLVDGVKTDKKAVKNFITFVRVSEPGTTIFTDTKFDETLVEKVNEVFAN
jgi:3-dehydroquinate synthase